MCVMCIVGAGVESIRKPNESSFRSFGINVRMRPSLLLFSSNFHYYFISKEDAKQRLQWSQCNNLRGEVIPRNDWKSWKEKKIRKWSRLRCT
jgi:hypothetical protein